MKGLSARKREMEYIHKLGHLNFLKPLYCNGSMAFLISFCFQNTILGTTELYACNIPDMGSDGYQDSWLYGSLSVVTDRSLLSLFSVFLL